MSDIIQKCECIHCNAWLSLQARTEGYCENCGKQLLSSQLTNSKASGQPAVVNAGEEVEAEVEPVQTPEQFRQEVRWSVAGWTLFCSLAIPALTLLVNPTFVSFLLFAALAFSLSLPLSYYFAKRSWTVRLVGLCFIFLFDLSVNILSCFG